MKRLICLLLGVIPFVLAAQAKPSRFLFTSFSGGLPGSAVLLADNGSDNATISTEEDSTTDDEITLSSPDSNTVEDDDKLVLPDQVTDEEAQKAAKARKRNNIIKGVLIGTVAVVATGAIIYFAIAVTTDSLSGFGTLCSDACGSSLNGLCDSSCDSLGSSFSNSCSNSISTQSCSKSVSSLSLASFGLMPVYIP